MKSKAKKQLIVGLCAALIFAGCNSTQQRAGEVTAGAAAGAGAGYLLGHKSPLATAGGAVAGALVTSLVLGKDKATYQEGVDHGYIEGSADQVKRLYFAKQALEQPRDGEGAGAMRYYVWEEEGTTPDGRKLAPEKIAVPVYEPLPVH